MTTSQRRQERSDDLELEVLLVAVAVGAPLEDADPECEGGAFGASISALKIPVSPVRFRVQAQTSRPASEAPWTAGYAGFHRLRRRPAPGAPDGSCRPRPPHGRLDDGCVLACHDGPLHPAPAPLPRRAPLR